MASPSAHAMPEHWTELIAAKQQKQLCWEELRALQSACEKTCGKTQVAECDDCYGKALNRMRQRYTASREREWFTQRKAFLHELEELFQEAMERKRSLEFVEARIESEKEAWYRWVLRKYPEFIAVSEGEARQEELRGMLDDPDRSRQELVGMMLEGVGAPAGWPSSVAAFAERVVAARGDAAELKRLYVAEFFLGRPPRGEVMENAQKYLDEYRASASLTLEDVIDHIASDTKESRHSQPQRESHQRRLDELRRAKTAFEHNKMQAKIRASASQAAAAAAAAAAGATAGADLYNLPPCQVCRGPVNASRVLSCSLCQAATQLGGVKRMTVYCGEECLHKGHDEHVRAEHDCEGGERCVQLRDEDVEMADGEGGGWRTVSCRACVEQKRMTVYCSARCAGENVAAHRQRWHGVLAAAAEAAEAAEGLVTSTHELVAATLKRENPGLVMTHVE